MNENFRYQEFEEKIAQAVRVIEQAAAAVDAEKLFLSCLADWCISKVGKASEESHGTVPAQSELLAFHLYPAFDHPGSAPVTPQLIQDVTGSVTGYFNMKAILEALSPEEDDVAEVVGQIRRRAEIVRGESYPEQTADRIVAVQGRFDDWFASRLGIAPSRAVDLLWAIYWTRARHADLFMEEVHLHAEGEEARWRAARLKRARGGSDEEKEFLRLKHPNDAYRRGYLQKLAEVAPLRMPVGWTDVAAGEVSFSEGEWQALARLVGLTRDVREQMTSPLQVREKPLFVLSDGRVFLVDLPHTLDVLWQELEREAQGDPAFYQEYQQARTEWLEEKIAQAVGRIFPSSCIYKNVGYPDPDKSGATAEVDLVAYYPPFLVLVEAKAKQFRLEAQLGDVGRLRTDLRKNIEDAFRQAQRAARYIATTTSPELVELATGRRLAIDPSKLRRTYLLTVSLRHLGGVANRLASLRDLGLFRTGEFPFAISICDLDLIVNLCEAPEVFLHYVERAMAIQRELPQMLADEADLFGAYLDSRLLSSHPFWRDAAKSSLFALSGWSTVLDAWVHFQRGELPTPPDELRLKLPPEIEEVLTELYRRGDEESRWTAFALLDTPYPVLDQLAHAIREMRKARLVPEAVRTLLGGQEDTVFCVLGALSPPVSPFASKLRDRALIEKYRRKAKRCFGFGLAIDCRDSPFEVNVLLDNPWVYDEDLEKLAQDRPAPSFLAGPGTVSRNAPCVCGSGKKYKKCCLPKIQGR